MPRRRSQKVNPPQAEALIEATGADFRIGGSSAFYSPAHDYLQVPRPDAFHEPVNWHGTAFHELGHPFTSWVIGSAGKAAVHSFKAHVGAEATTALVEKISITPANIDDGSASPDALPDNPGEVLADSVYRAPISAVPCSPKVVAAHRRNRHVAERQQRVAAKAANGDDDRLLLDRQHGEFRFFRSGRQVRRRGALLPLGEGLLVDPVPPGDSPRALLTMLYRSTDRLSRRGAPMEYLGHNASFHSLVNDAPSKPRIKRLEADARTEFEAA